MHLGYIALQHNKVKQVRNPIYTVRGQASRRQFTSNKCTFFQVLLFQHDFMFIVSTQSYRTVFTVFLVLCDCRLEG